MSREVQNPEAQVDVFPIHKTRWALAVYSMLYAVEGDSGQFTRAFLLDTSRSDCGMSQ